MKLYEELHINKKQLKIRFLKSLIFLVLKIKKDGEKAVEKLWETMRDAEDKAMSNLDSKEKKFAQLINKECSK